MRLLLSLIVLLWAVPVAAQGTAGSPAPVVPTVPANVPLKLTIQVDETTASACAYIDAGASECVSTQPSTAVVILLPAVVAGDHVVSFLARSEAGAVSEPTSVAFTALADAPKPPKPPTFISITTTTTATLTFPSGQTVTVPLASQTVDATGLLSPR
jgi:hypothetical protein